MPQPDWIHSVWGYYDAHARNLPWREPEANGSFDPYKILVSEIMLQQTQVSRVIPKYATFLAAYPTTSALAQAELGDVLRLWSGLGYNRRAKYLWQAAQAVCADFAGQLPADSKLLQTLPGVGVNTAGAVMAYAFDCPVVFVETNIRTVLIHHCFDSSRTDISDAELRPLLQQALDVVTTDQSRTVRNWYWALMDYGSYLKSVSGNAANRSRHNTKQSKFEGSLRQLRGQILRLLAGGPMTQLELDKQLSDKRLPSVLQTLAAEGLVKCDSQKYSI